MKIKSLLIGMLACTALVGCSDDAIENIAQENNEVKNNAKGYLSVSFSADTNSSRGLYDNAYGDQCDDAENNGHLNAGSANENNVNEILVVINSGDAEYSKLFLSSQIIGAGEVKEGDVVTKYNNQYTTTPFEVELGEYKALVVINPSQSIKDVKNTMTFEDTSGKNIGDTFLYDAILNHKVKPESGEWTLSSAIASVTVKDQEQNNFMMTNRLPASITVTAQNSTQETAAGKDSYIEVERVISKVTLRDVANNDFMYEVPFYSYEIVVKEETGWLSSTEGDLNEDNDVTARRYKYTGSNGDVVVWGITTTTTEGETQTSNTAYYTLSVNSDSKNIFTPVTVPSGVTPELYNEKTTTAKNMGWSVKLTGYALVNLSQDLYAVRHIGSADYNENNYQIMGALNTNYPYLVDPVSHEKNEVIWNNGNWPSTVTAANWDSWFFNSWENVKSATLANAQNKTDFFHSFYDNDGNLLLTTDTPQKVNSAHTQDTGNAAETRNTIGYHLQYCFENAVKQFNTNGQDLQTIGLSTAIVFEAQILEEINGELQPIDDQLYQYEGNLYTSIEDIVLLYGITANTAGWINLFDATGNLKAEKDMPVADIEALKIKIYQGGKCYYYTSQIKHYDDGNNTTNGVMEFAIMRNNIYSLGITGIQHIGDANLDGFNPADPDESATAWIQVNAKILPWIVRFTDVEF